MSNVVISFFIPSEGYTHSQNAYNSVKAACERWGCEYIVFKQPIQPAGFHNMFTKLFLPSLVSSYKQCLYIDTDIIINSTTPNPFDVFSNEKNIYVVRDMQQSFLTKDQKEEFKNTQLCLPWLNVCEDALGIKFDKQSYKDNFFNAGMFLFSPINHMYVFKKIITALNNITGKYKNIHQVEQALLNLAFMYFLDKRLIFINKKWNYIDPDIDNEYMNGYLYHFTGWYYEKYKTEINKYTKWKY